MPHSENTERKPAFLSKKASFLIVALCGGDLHPYPPHKGVGTWAVTKTLIFLLLRVPWPVVSVGAEILAARL